jgi:hypothetical protein
MGLLITSLAHLHVRERTEGRAPVWGPEFTVKVATIQGDQKNRAYATQKIL